MTNFHNVSFIFPDVKYLFRTSESMAFELQLPPVNNKTCRGSLNLAIMILGYASTNAAHIFCENVFHSIPKQD